jgi:hypothetical protein
MVRIVFVSLLTVAGLSCVLASTVFFLQGNGMGPVTFPDRPDLRGLSCLLIFAALGLLTAAAFVLQFRRSDE